MVDENLREAHQAAANFTSPLQRWLNARTTATFFTSRKAEKNKVDPAEISGALRRGFSATEAVRATEEEFPNPLSGLVGNLSTKIYPRLPNGLISARGAIAIAVACGTEELLKCQNARVRSEMKQFSQGTETKRDSSSRVTMDNVPYRSAFSSVKMATDVAEQNEDAWFDTSLEALSEVDLSKGWLAQMICYAQGLKTGQPDALLPPHLLLPRERIDFQRPSFENTAASRGDSSFGPQFGNSNLLDVSMYAVKKTAPLTFLDKIKKEDESPTMTLIEASGCVKRKTHFLAPCRARVRRPRSVSPSPVTKKVSNKRRKLEENAQESKRSISIGRKPPAVSAPVPLFTERRLLRRFGSVRRRLFDDLSSDV